MLFVHGEADLHACAYWAHIKLFTSATFWNIAEMCAADDIVSEEL